MPREPEAIALNPEEPRSAHDGSTTRLSGNRLTIARSAWFAIAISSLIVLFFVIPAAYRNASYLFYTVCTEHSDGCPGLVLGQLGLLVGGPVLLAMAFGLIALVIFRLKSNDWVVMLASLTMLTFGVTINAHNFNAQLPPPAIALLTEILQALMFTFGVLFFCLFPDGRFTPRWTRALPLFSIAATIGAFVFPATFFDTDRWDGTLTGLYYFAWACLFVFVQVYRYARVSTPEQRQQTKWILFGLGVSALLVAVFIAFATIYESLPALEIEVPLGLSYAWFALLILALISVPVSVGVSVLRYRLWNIDFIINRTLVFGALTVVLGLAFLATFMLLPSLFRSFTGASQYPIVIAASALVMGSLFQPARYRLQSLVDRRFFGIQIDYGKTLRPLTPAIGAIRQSALADYTDLELIGIGGMAEVYRGRHPALDRLVAIKITPPSLAATSTFGERFKREASVVATLRHPNIIQVFDFGEADGRYYLIMEYIAGPDLESLLQERGRLTLEEALPLLRGIAAGLNYAHERDLVHRDIKPSNILLDPIGDAPPNDRDYRAVIADFGLAKIIGGSTHITRSGVLGTLSYIAPEQIQASADVDRRADVYSLGVTVFRMLAGELPFNHQNPGALLIAHLTQPPPDVRELLPDQPRGVALAIERALAKDPNQRFPTAGEFVAALS